MLTWAVNSHSEGISAEDHIEMIFMIHLQGPVAPIIAHVTMIESRYETMAAYLLSKDLALLYTDKIL